MYLLDCTGYWHKVTNNKLETSDHAGWLGGGDIVSGGEEERPGPSPLPCISPSHHSPRVINSWGAVISVGGERGGRRG